MKIRDSQRARVYKSDKDLMKIAKPLPTVADIEKYAVRLFKSKRLAAKYPRAVIRGAPEVGDGRRTRRALAHGGWKITVPVWARNEAIVLHELAHIITVRQFWLQTHAPHGWQFAAVYLDLVKWMMGGAAHDALKASFKAHKVKFRKPVKRNLTDEQRAALAARLQTARLKKAA
jgi:putative metallohydrolase (TIGR04338 family)